MSAGLLAATQLFYPAANLNLQFTTFGRVRPLHTNAVIFAFVGNGMFMGIYYSLQRLCKARMFSDALSWINFWGWNAIIVAAAITLPLGLTTSKEYAELEWPVDMAIAVVWVAFTINLMGTILRRRERHMYVAIWFYIATAVTVAVLHIVNSLAVPATFFKSYSIYAGVQDALVQWWYGHNAVAFFLTTPYLGLMYYFLPKAANRPIFSYRLSIIHFWALDLRLHLGRAASPALYGAAGLGAVAGDGVFGDAGGAVVGRDVERVADLARRLGQGPAGSDAEVHGGGGDGLRHGDARGTDLAIKSVNSLSHYTDWTIAHVHTGALGWNGFLTFSMLYWLFPRLYNTRLWSVKLANYHFWIAAAGHDVLRGADVLERDHAGAHVEAVQLGRVHAVSELSWRRCCRLLPMYMLRAIGGSLYIIGACLMAFNLWRTAKSGSSFRKGSAGAGADPSGHRWRNIRGASLARVQAGAFTALTVWPC
jgi:cytochrome c oxidase cbb3-type subunit I/II